MNYKRQDMQYEDIEVNSIKWLELNNLKNEIWKDIPGYEQLYQASNYGRIKTLKYNDSKRIHIKTRILKQCLNENGYYIVNLSNKSCRVHRLIAKAFIKKDLNSKNIINHINGIKQDNRLSNLEVCTSSHNNKEAYRLGLKKPTVKRGKDYTKKLRTIVKYDLSGKYIEKYYGTGELKRENNYSPTSIHNCCKGKRNSAYGYLWAYENEKPQKFNSNYKSRNFKNYGKN